MLFTEKKKRGVLANPSFSSMSIQIPRNVFCRVNCAKSFSIGKSFTLSLNSLIVCLNTTKTVIMI